MHYNFANLSDVDFEDLARDLIGRELGIRFEAFAVGADEGMDGRHAAADGHIVLQAKHYIGSDLSGLKKAMRKERAAIDKLSPTRYILATSLDVQPGSKTALAEIIGPSLKAEKDIYLRADLEGLLRKFGDIAKAHIKLWLSSTEILEHIVSAAANTVTALSKKEIEAKVRVYASNPSLGEARDKLEAHHVVIISGPPGVGKSTLGQMLAWAHITEGWEYHEIRSLDDGFAKLIDDAVRRIFFFDDFLGRVALDANALAARDSDLARFIRMVRSSQNARFILTTRTHLFEEARQLSDRLADGKLDITRYALDVGKYTRRIKARILYNHLYVSGTSPAYIKALWDAGAIEKIIDHPNYSPRIVEAMTDRFHISDLAADNYPGAFLATLDNPALIWEKAFKKHISKRCQHLLIALFFASEYGVSSDILREVYEPLHEFLSGRFNSERSPKDFEEALQILEGGFVAITSRRISFVNPSLRDYLGNYLADASMLKEFAISAHKPDWANNLWKYAKELDFGEPVMKQLAVNLKGTLPGMLTAKVFTTVVSRPGTVEKSDLATAARIELLIEWWDLTKDPAFSDGILQLLRNPVGGFNSWLDGDTFIELAAKLPDPDYYTPLPNLADITQALEDAIIDILDWHPSYDELESIADSVDRHEARLSSRVINAMSQALTEHIDNIEDRIADEDSESNLEEQIKAVQKFAARAQASTATVEKAVKAINAKIKDLSERDIEEGSSPKITSTARETDKFDSAAIRNLFAPLISSDRESTG